MNGLRLTCYLVCLAFLLTLLGGLVTQPIAFAVSGDSANLPSIWPNQESPPVEQIVLGCKYPVLSSSADSYFSYGIELSYRGGKEPRLFDLRVDVPPSFNYSITPSYGESGEIRSIRLDPSSTDPDSIKVMVSPLMGGLPPEPGEYPVTVEASSGALKGSIQLKAVVTAKYNLDFEPANGRYNTEATAGKDNYFTVTITNSGSAPLDKIVFSSIVRGTPSGWSITFRPDKIDSLSVGDKRDVEVNIKPASKTIAGDYMVNVSAQPESKNAIGSAELRVTVLAPTIWGWVGIGIVILVIAGLAVMFMRLGRR
jgi:uncharacterized membrane protein